MVTNKSIQIDILGSGNTYTMLPQVFGCSTYQIPSIPFGDKSVDKYSIQSVKELQLDIKHKNFAELEFNLLDAAHSVKYDEINHKFILKLDTLMDLVLKIGFDESGMWVKVCN